MKILILCPGRVPQDPSDITCFSDVWAYYLVRELRKSMTIKTLMIPQLKDNDLVDWFETIDVAGYDAIIALGLRYFSTVPREIGERLKERIRPGLLCQIYDGSRLDSDPVDITFTIRNDAGKYTLNSPADRYTRHHIYNRYVGWATDPVLNKSVQDPDVLKILVDHTNYGDNPVDLTIDILNQIKKFVKSNIWRGKYQSVSVRRFDSGRVIEVDFNQPFDIKKYDRSPIPFPEICKEHGQAHIFCVTHPESVGLVVLETATAGALVLSPAGFISKDRLSTVFAIEWKGQIDWCEALNNIDPKKSRRIAMKNSWSAVVGRIKDAIESYLPVVTKSTQSKNPISTDIAKVSSDKPREIKTPINVVCLKWGKKYGSEYVNRLYAGIKRNTTVPFNFWCFTDSSAEISPQIKVADLPYSTELESWWNKINLFSNDLPISLGERIFYIDLDTLITDNIDEMLLVDSEKIIVLRDFYHGIAKTAGSVASGLMTWIHGTHDFVWQKFIKDPQKAIRSVRPHGDQAWVEKCVLEICDYWQDLFPKQVVSFKIDCNSGLPKNAAIVCYHGRPSIPESIVNHTIDWRWDLRPQPWVADYWKE